MLVLANHVAIKEAAKAEKSKLWQLALLSRPLVKLVEDTINPIHSPLDQTTCARKALCDRRAGLREHTDSLGAKKISPYNRIPSETSNKATFLGRRWYGLHIKFVCILEARRAQMLVRLF
jgi:hypothetical protein